jgi:hypothetical protein
MPQYFAPGADSGIKRKIEAELPWKPPLMSDLMFFVQLWQGS